MLEQNGYELSVEAIKKLSPKIVAFTGNPNLEAVTVEGILIGIFEYKNSKEHGLEFSYKVNTTKEKIL